jgi:hypothetical protein
MHNDYKNSKLYPVITQKKSPLPTAKSLKELGNRPIENITFNEIKPYLIEEKKFMREITQNISIRNGPKGDYIFYKTTKMKKPLFFSLTNFKGTYKTENISVIKSWIKDNYDIL